MPEVCTGEVQGNVRAEEGAPSTMAARKPRAVTADPSPPTGLDRTAITEDRDWRAMAERAMVTILDRAQDLAASCGDIKQLIELGRMVGETVVAGEMGKIDGKEPKSAAPSGGDGGESEE